MGVDGADVWVAGEFGGLLGGVGAGRRLYI